MMKLSFNRLITYPEDQVGQIFVSSTVLAQDRSNESGHSGDLRGDSLSLVHSGDKVKTLIIYHICHHSLLTPVGSTTWVYLLADHIAQAVHDGIALLVLSHCQHVFHHEARGVWHQPQGIDSGVDFKSSFVKLPELSEHDAGAL